MEARVCDVCGKVMPTGNTNKGVSLTRCRRTGICSMFEPKEETIDICNECWEVIKKARRGEIHE